ncbi:tetratricopeptide repeat protein [Pseudodesulfovibrio thermohalotolerans]|uniref:tetratricopeptide repeat protein n=1 Tax=Pseudodesulfovibrio thermohalotolerans TaxID=2880651 RepID=UPI0024422A66|nr:tetratricopeptide repeat protein [Pseudodesulfovibrio thermohalotolerans]WFS64322.1 tetratricopeptide repeat protein [Pseudodesulfovibrio thermohalotolerans]
MRAVDDYPAILGVYSLQIQADVGTGHTSVSHANITYWYARQLSPEQFEIQPLNAHHVPSGVRSVLGELDFLRQYTPEPTYYRVHTVPALETLRRKIEMGQEAFSKGNLDEAERQFLKALMIDDKNIDANYGLGEVYSEKKQFDKLKKVLDTLLGLDEAFTFEFRNKFNSFGISLRKNGHYDESIRYYEKSLEIVNTDENVYFNLARVYYEKGSSDSCMDNLEQALKINPAFVEAQKFLNYCRKHA